MSLSISPGQVVTSSAARGERGHFWRVVLAALASSALIAALTAFGAKYYLLPMEERPYSPLHPILRPSGSIGLKLGIFGTVLFFIIFLYALRKVIPWLGRIGTARHWMDFHVIAGVTAPIIIAFHASFKFQGIAGVAFWIMLAVACSGIIGRYLYAQIPRSLSSAELSLTELEGTEHELADALLRQSIYSAAQLARALRVPSREQIARLNPASAIARMILQDLVMPFRMARLRLAHASFARALRSFGGFLSTGNAEVELIVSTVRKKVALSRRVAFLHHTHRVFHLWHVIHRPFSYAFVVLALIHIAVVMGLGFAGLGVR